MAQGRGGDQCRSVGQIGRSRGVLGTRATSSPTGTPHSWQRRKESVHHSLVHNSIILPLHRQHINRTFHNQRSLTQPVGKRLLWRRNFELAWTHWPAVHAAYLPSEKRCVSATARAFLNHADTTECSCGLPIVLATGDTSPLNDTSHVASSGVNGHR